MASLRMLALPAIAAILVLIAGCAPATPSESESLEIVATTSVWGDVVGEIIGDDAGVHILISSGTDPHDYEPTSRDVAALQEADLLVANGLDLESGLSDVLRNAEEDGANLIELAPDLNPLPFAGHGVNGDDDEDGDLDPHVWLDPMRVVIAAELIAEQLSEIDDSVDWDSRADDYSAELAQTDDKISRMLDEVPPEKRKLVTNHDALGYFADRYGFEVIAVVIPGGSTMGDPSSAEMAALVEEIRREGVNTIFAETSGPSSLAEAVAAEVGEDVSVVELYTGALGEPGSGADSLTGMLLTNATRIRDALVR